MKQLPPNVRRNLTYATVATLLVGGLTYAVQPLSASPRSAARSVVPEATVALSESELARGEAAQLGLAAAGMRSDRNTASVEARPKVETYTVVAGDTISTIAVRFGLKTESVLWANELEAEDTLAIGDELLIPGIDGLVRKVQTGDTLWDIASDHGADVDAIVQANPDIEPGALKPGQVLLIPGGQPVSRRQLASRGAGRPAAGRVFEFRPAVGAISDPFGWRIHPVYGTQNFHDGMDIDIGSGTPLKAVSAGTVVMASRFGGYGLAVRIDHGRGLVTQYSHMSGMDVTVGQKVAAGEHIGYSGNTGVTTGPHLHFSLMVNGSPVDPEPYMP